MVTLAFGCAPASGTLRVIVESEDTITRGIAAGEGAENLRDGWSVTFTDYVIGIGHLDLHLATDEDVEAEAHEVYAVDLVDVPAAGLPLWTVEGLETGRWELHYAIGAHGAMAHESVSAAELEEISTNDWTYLIAGAMTHPTGQSCPPAGLASPGAATPNGNTNAGGDACYDNASVSFWLGFEAETVFGPCEVDEIPGVAITDGSTTTAALTIHGDHLFFNGFPEGGEGGVMRLAQWLADCDLDLDGAVTREELEAIAPADLAELDARFQLGGSPITPLETMWDYVRAQGKTQGHFQGEGECPIDGVAHDH